MLFLILCICKAFRLDYVLTLSFPLSNTNQYISSLKDDTLSRSKHDFSPVRRENKQLEKGMQLMGFKAVVYVEHILVAFCFTIECWSAAPMNLHTGNKFIYWGILHFILHFIELNLDKEIMGNFKTDSTYLDKTPHKTRIRRAR